MPLKDDIRQLADLKQQISQKSVLLRSTVSCELADVVLKRRCKLLSFIYNNLL